MNGAHVLRDVLHFHVAKLRLPQHKLQVMNYEHDPYFIDRDACHRDAQWFAHWWKESGLAGRDGGAHVRGLHYVLVSQSEPPRMPGSNKPYKNTTRCWDWLTQVSNKARWLGYVPFEDVIDERNDAPMIFDFASPGIPQVSIDEGGFYLSDLFPRPVTLNAQRGFGSLTDQLPDIKTSGFHVQQPYRLAIIGEKSSLRHVLEPIARRYRAELILPTGDLSQVLFWGMCKRADEDGRPLRVFYCADFDPSGLNMGRVVARKLQAMRDLFYPKLNVQLRRVALTFEQVREFKLPSTPMKEKEKRADRWRERFGVEQTEVDSLATLRPDDFARLVTDALDHYHDPTLDSRVRIYESRLQAKATAAIEQAFAERTPQVAEITARIHELNAAGAVIEQRLEEIQAMLDALNQEMTELNESQRPERDALEAAGSALLNEVADAGLDALDNIKLPQPQCDGDVDEPLFDSERDWGEQTLLLMEDRV